ncbi:MULTISPECIES: hypothetical protein [unclassified Methanoculleus]|uniref:hypothetical protein n=1 Tax=unclassified Methanoculleus TaxID=2619537 RepID=UPI0025E233E4|nr:MULTISPECIES: hypothetical protein [unclassified Methanoculleus]
MEALALQRSLLFTDERRDNGRGPGQTPLYRHRSRNAGRIAMIPPTTAKIATIKGHCRYRWVGEEEETEDDAENPGMFVPHPPL